MTDEFESLDNSTRKFLRTLNRAAIEHELADDKVATLLREAANKIPAEKLTPLLIKHVAMNSKFEEKMEAAMALYDREFAKLEALLAEKK